MATRPGTHSVLLVADVQVGVVAAAWERDRIVGNVALSVRRARESGVPVVWVQHHDGQGVSRIFLAGAATNWCVRATAYGALDRGFDVTLLSDAHTTENIELSPGRVVDARSVVDDLNVAMRWLSYPGRTNAVATAAGADFARPNHCPVR